MAAKKAAAKKAASAEPTATDVATEESEQGVRENNPAGVHDALKSPTTADLNPAYR